MKFKIEMKDPDGVHDSVRRAAEASVAGITGLGDNEREELIEGRHSEIDKRLKKWFKYSENLTVEIDTEAGTAIVCEAP